MGVLNRFRILQEPEIIDVGTLNGRSPPPFWAGLEADPARADPQASMIPSSGRNSRCKSPEPGSIFDTHTVAWQHQ